MLMLVWKRYIHSQRHSILAVLVPLPQIAQGGMGGSFHAIQHPLPSSAAVERMFCTGGNILRAKRSSMASQKFDHLVFLKGNLRYLGHQI